MMMMEAMDGFDNPMTAAYMMNQAQNQRPGGTQGNMMNEILPLAIMTDAGDMKDLAMIGAMSGGMNGQRRPVLESCNTTIVNLCF